MNKIIINLLLITLSVVLTGCSTKSITNEKSSLKSIPRGNNAFAANSLRIQALRDTALSVGARGGLAWRTKNIQTSIVKYHRHLDRIFNFHALLVEGTVLPPILMEARNALSLTGPDIIRIADRNYKILNQAKFVTAPPNWREYILKSFEKPELPDKSLLPKNADEQKIWNKYIDQGWAAGVKQADDILKENLSMLTRDFNGMILYRKLLAQGMITPPFVSSIELGITGDKNNLTVNDKVLKITAFPSLQTDGSQWKTKIKQYE
jgi:defect-in-organelle-trafficking protein DotC